MGIQRNSKQVFGHSMIDEIEQIEDRVNEILRSDHQVREITEQYLYNKIDAFDAIVKIVDRVEYIYHFNPVNTHPASDRIECLSLYFVGGAMDSKMRLMEKSIDRHKLVHIIELMFFILILVKSLL